MKAEELILALNDVNDKYIREAAEYQKKTAGSLKVWRAVAIAACACLAVSALFAITAVNQNGARRTLESARTDTYYDDYYAEEMEELPLYYASDDAQISLPSGNSAIAYDETVAETGIYEEAYAEDMAYDGVSANKAAVTGSGLYADALSQTRYSPKIIYSVYMEMQTREYDNAISEIEQAIAAFNGYSESQSLSGDAGSYRNASYSIRVPAENLDDFLQQAGEIGTVTYITKNAQDVSENYYDTQSRLDAAKAKQERLQELLGQAEDMADIIEIESAMTDTQWEIDNYSGTLRYYDSRVEYSTVNIELREVYEVVTEEVPMTFGEKIGQAFTRGIKSVGTFFKNVVIWISASWIWLLILAAVIVIAVLVVRRIVRRRRNRS